MIVSNNHHITWIVFGLWCPFKSLNFFEYIAKCSAFKAPIKLNSLADSIQFGIIGESFSPNESIDLWFFALNTQNFKFSILFFTGVFSENLANQTIILGSRSDIFGRERR